MLTDPEPALVELPTVANKLITPRDPAIARVAGNTVCTHGKSNAWVRNIALDVSGTKLAGAFRVGQAFGVVPPGVDENGKPHSVRLYSIASPDAGEDGAGKVVCTPVKRVIDEFRNDKPDAHQRRGMFMGVCSNYLCDLEVGEEVRITGPVGKRFLLSVHPGDHNYVFIATGTGIAPYRGMVLQLLEGLAGPVSSQIWLLAGSPYTSDLLYHDLFLRLQQKFDNFHYLQAISREPNGDAGRGIYVDKLIEMNIDPLGPVLEDRSTLLYLCGLAGTQFSVYRRLAMLGLLDGYATPSQSALQLDPSAWTPAQVKRSVRATARCMIEVY